MTGRTLLAGGVVAVMGLGLALLGAWGYRSADVLTPAALDVDERVHRARVLRTGAVGCCLAGVVLLLGATVGLARG